MSSEVWASLRRRSREDRTHSTAHGSVSLDVRVLLIPGAAFIRNAPFDASMRELLRCAPAKDVPIGVALRELANDCECLLTCLRLQAVNLKRHLYEKLGIPPITPQLQLQNACHGRQRTLIQYVVPRRHTSTLFPDDLTPVSVLP